MKLDRNIRVQRPLELGRTRKSPFKWSTLLFLSLLPRFPMFARRFLPLSSFSLFRIRFIALELFGEGWKPVSRAFRSIRAFFSLSRTSGLNPIPRSSTVLNGARDSSYFESVWNSLLERGGQESRPIARGASTSRLQSETLVRRCRFSTLENLAPPFEKSVRSFPERILYILGLLESSVGIYDIIFAK